MRGSRKSWVCVAAAIALFAVSGCGSDDDGGEAAAQGDGGGLSGTVKVGAIQELSGPASIVGQSSKKGMAIAMDHIAEDKVLGDAKLELLERDHKSDKTQAATVARDLILKDKVAALTGINLAPATLTIGPIAGQLKTPAIADTSVDESFSEICDYCFSSVTPWFETIPVFVEQYLAGEKKYKSGVVFENIDIPAEGRQADAFEKSMEENGMTVVPRQKNQSTTSDYSPQLTEVKKADPDVIIVQDLAQNNAAIMKQAKALGIRADIVGTTAVMSAAVPEIAGPDAEGVRLFAAWAPDAPGEVNQRFVDDFRAKYDADPGVWEVEGYTALMILADAIRRAGSTDRDAIRDAIASTENFETPQGTFTYRPSRVPDGGNKLLVEIKDGKFTTVGPLE
jgi:branched-chain amino acid transport system substrate-binding protein